MANPAVTYSFSNGTTIDAGEVNTNFQDLIDSLTDATKSLSIDALTAAGAATLNGNVTLGNASTDDLTINASLASSIAIKTADTYNIGSAALGLNAIYFGDNGFSVGVKADAAASADWTFSFPPASGTVGYGLQAASSGAHIYVPMQTDTHSVSSADYTVLDTDGYRHIDVTTGSTTRTITLPTAADNTDRLITVMKADTGTGFVTVDGEGAETINGKTTYQLFGQYDSVTLRCTGSAWLVIDSRHHWVNYTPSNTQGFGTVSSVALQFRRNGADIEIRGDFTSGTITADEAQLSLPNSLTIASTSSNPQPAGFFFRAVSSLQSMGTILATSGDAFFNFGLYVNNASSAPLTVRGGTSLFGSSETIAFTAKAPVAEWA